GANFNFGLDDVLFPVALRCRNISRQTKAFKRGERDIVSAPDAGFKHASAPHGNIVALGDIVDFLGLGETADAADFNVDDAAGACLKCEIGVARVVNGFVESDRGLDLFLQPSMQLDFVVPQRLLNHQQLERVEFTQVLRFVERISGIGVDAEYNVGPARADLFENVQVPAGLDLDFDASVTGGQFGRDLLEKLLGRILNANRNPAGNFAARSTKQFPKRLLLESRFSVPHRVLEPCFRHPMPTDASKQRRAVATGGDIRALKK